MSDKKRLIKSVTFGALSAVPIMIILMCLLSVVMLSIGLLPQSVIDYAMVGIIAAGAFWGGIVATKLNRGAGLIVGTLTGLAVFVFVAIAGLSNGSSVSILSLIKLVASVLCGALGGIVGLRERQKIRI